MVAAVDVTAQHEARGRGLAAAEDRFRLAARHAPIGVAIVALDGVLLEATTRSAGCSATDTAS